MAPVKVLLTGATGYIGGSILHRLLNSTNATTKSLEISVLVRDDSRTDYFRSQGLTVHTMASLDDHDAIVSAASQNDVVIHAGLGYHTGSPRSHIIGLAQRKATTNNPVFYLHTSGTSNLADRPITKTFSEDRTFSDTDTDIYAYLQSREAGEAYPQRTADLVTIETGRLQDVLTTIIMSPNIYAPGTGPFNKTSIQIPLQIRGALKKGVAGYIGDGKGQWDYVHIEDLARLYEEVVLDFVEQRNQVPHGETGIMFSGTGVFKWHEMAAGIGDAGKELGALQHGEPQSWTLPQAIDAWFGGSGLEAMAAEVCELGFSSNSRTKADVGKKIGWKPQKTVEDWRENFKVEFEMILEADKKK